MSRSINKILLFGGFFAVAVLPYLSSFASAAFLSASDELYKCYIPNKLQCNCHRVYCSFLLIQHSAIYEEEEKCLKSLENTDCSKKFVFPSPLLKNSKADEIETKLSSEEAPTIFPSEYMTSESAPTEYYYSTISPSEFPFEAPEEDKKVAAISAPDEEGKDQSEARKMSELKLLKPKKKLRDGTKLSTSTPSPTTTASNEKKKPLSAKTKKLLSLRVIDILEHPEKNGKGIAKIIADVVNLNSEVVKKYKDNIITLFGYVKHEVDKKGGFTLQKIMKLFASVGGSLK